MALYERCGKEIDDLTANLMKRHHEDLVKHKLTVCCIFMKPKDGELHALYHHGYPAAATVKAINEIHRAMGCKDVVITIDAGSWKKFTEPQRAALIDHELEHVKIKKNDKGEVQYDDNGRPKIELEKHDWHEGGFDIIVQRHGDAAIELMNMRRTMERFPSLFDSDTPRRQAR